LIERWGIYPIPTLPTYRLSGAKNPRNQGRDKQYAAARAKVLELAREHTEMRQADIAEFVGMSSSFVECALRAAGIKSAYKGGFHPKAAASREEAIGQYAREHPEETQGEIGKHFGISACRVSTIMCRLNIKRMETKTEVRGGHVLERRPWWSDLQYAWEIRLCRMGLGMRRGEQRLIYVGGVQEVEMAMRGFENEAGKGIEESRQHEHGHRTPVLFSEY
jgi:hypothetical protein